jgi:hypothetical protein
LSAASTGMHKRKNPRIAIHSRVMISNLEPSS